MVRGIYLGIIASMVFYTLLLLRIDRRLLTIITLIVVSFYLYITDIPVSLLRAYIMVAVFSIQYLFNLEKNIVNTLFISAIAILVIYPYDLYDLGFQLSFGATLGIILFFRIYRRVFSVLPSFISNTLAVTVSAQIMVLPVILFQLNEINLTGVLSNLVLIPATSFTLVMSVIANIASLFSDNIAQIAAFITDKSNVVDTLLVQFFSKINGHFYFEGYYCALLLPYLCLLAPLAPMPKFNKLPLFLFISGLIFSWALLLNFSIPESRQAAVIQRDKSSILHYKDGDKAVIIGNCEAKNHADSLTNYILNNNIRSIELYIPHPDFNSLKNFSHLIKKNVVKRCVVSSDAISNFYFKKFCGIVDNDGIKMEVNDFNKPLQAGDKNNTGEIYMLYDLMIKGELNQNKTGCAVIFL